jgi:hypothetical protein
MKYIAAMVLVGVMAGTAIAQLKATVGRHEDGWTLRLVCPTIVKKGETCEMQVWLAHTATKRLKSNLVPTGHDAIVELTIADKDTFSRDDVVLTKTFRFKAGDRIKIKEMFCGNLKKDLGSKSEIYTRVSIRASLKGVGSIGKLILDYKATVKTPTIKVKTVK